MPISLSPLGEESVAAMAERERIATVDALGLTESADIEHVRTAGTFAFHLLVGRVETPSWRVPLKRSRTSRCQGARFAFRKR